MYWVENDAKRTGVEKHVKKERSLQSLQKEWNHEPIISTLTVGSEKQHTSCFLKVPFSVHLRCPCSHSVHRNEKLFKTATNRFIKAFIMDGKSGRSLLELDVQKRSGYLQTFVKIDGATAGFLQKQSLFDQNEEQKKI